MKALIVKGTTRAGKILNEGDVVEMTEHEFRIFELCGQAKAIIDQPKPLAQPEPQPKEPTATTAKRKKRKA